MSDLHQAIVTPDGSDALHEPGNDDYHPKYIVSVIPPQRQHNKVHKKNSKPKLVIDRNFMCFLQPGGVVHAYMGQKLLKPYILRVFWLTDYELFHATFYQTDA